MAEKKKTFEESIARLDIIVKQLEKGDVPLNESLALFEEGTALISACNMMLEEAEQKVVKLRKGPDGEPWNFPSRRKNRFGRHIRKIQGMIEEALALYFADPGAPYGRLLESMRYSLLSGASV
jgi:exodeoxyribonuclease VII small subunit